jgi:hypothetical protein
MPIFPFGNQDKEPSDPDAQFPKARTRQWGDGLDENTLGVWGEDLTGHVEPVLSVALADQPWHHS